MGQEILSRERTDAGLQHEVAQRQQAEEVARQRLIEIEDLYRNAPVGLCVLDRELRWVRINERLAEINGLPAAAHLGKRVRDLMPELAEAVEPEMRRVLETGQPRLNIEIVSQTPAQPGVQRSWLEHWLPIADAQGQVIGLSIVVEETTERKRAEEALRESRRAALSLMEDAMAARRQAEEALAALRQSREDLARAQAVGQIGSWRLDVSRNVLTWSDENHRIFGVPKGTPLTYETFLEIVHPDDRQYVDTQWKAGLRGEPYDIEHRLVVAGQVKWVREKAYREFDDAGKPLGGFGITEDITERKRAEEEIRALSLFPEQNPNPVLRIARDGAILYANSASAPLLRVWEARCGELAPSDWIQRAASALASGKVEETEVACLGRVYSCVLAPIGDQGYVNLYARDITPLRQSEQALQRLNAELEERVAERTAEVQASEARYRSFVTASTQVIWTTDAQGLVAGDMPSWRAFTGQSLEEIQGWSWLDALHPDDRQRTAEIWSQAVAARSLYAVEYRVRRHDGQYRWLSVRGVPVLAGTTVREWVGACTDVTEQKRAEEEVRHVREELAHVDRVARLGELAASLAHELNQPLAAILSNAQAARRFLATTPPDLDLFREILNDIIRDDKRAGNVIQRLRLLLQKGRPEPETISLNDAIREVVQLLHSELLGRNVALRMDLAPELPAVRAGRVEVQQVLVNLLLNALDALKDVPPDRHEIRIRTGQNENAVVVAIRDRGFGIPPPEINRIFEPFFTTKSVGLGMGLAICRRIIQAHGGGIWAANNDDAGATVSFSLPFTQASGDPSHE